MRMIQTTDIIIGDEKAVQFINIITRFSGIVFDTVGGA